MTDTQRNSPPGALAHLLATARDRVEAGSYADALASVREAKQLQPRNVYVLAFERQVEQLLELSAAGKLGDDERLDIVESIPGIMDRALEGPGEQPPSPAPAPDAASLEQARAERAAAHEWLKNQYFQHAHEYVKKGEYEHALAEIRRVFIIDPGNKIARDFELQIDELTHIKRESGIVPPASKKPADKPAAKAAAPAKGEPNAATAVPAKAAGTPPPGRKKLTPLSILLLFLALALLAFATVYLIKKLESPSKPAPRSTISAPQRELYAPERTAPPADTLRAPRDTTSAE